MKKTLIIITALTVAAITSAAAQTRGGISISGATVITDFDGVRLDMTLSVGADAVHDLQSVALVPVLSAGPMYIAEFPPVLVNGRNRARVYARTARFRRDEIAQNPPYKVIDLNRNYSGEQIDYSARIEGRQWMRGAPLSIVYVITSPGGRVHSYSMPVVGTSVAAVPDTAGPAHVHEPVPVAAVPITQPEVPVFVPVPEPGEPIVIDVVPTPEPAPEPAPASPSELVVAQPAPTTDADYWAALHTAVEAGSLPYKSEILKVIAGPLTGAEKELRLRRMMGGQIWRQMERDIFPVLPKKAR